MHMYFYDICFQRLLNGEIYLHMSTVNITVDRLDNAESTICCYAKASMANFISPSAQQKFSAGNST